MATIQGQSDSVAQGVIKTTWETLATGSLDGSKAGHSGYPNKTVQAVGTWDTATLTMQGSNDGTNWFTLTDLQGNALSWTANSAEAIEESPRYIRPLVSSVGASTDLDVVLIESKN